MKNFYYNLRIKNRSIIIFKWRIKVRLICKGVDIF